LGADRFDFNAIGESKSGRGRDIVTDFTRGEDKIDISTIDANGSASGNGAFTLLAEGAGFNGKKGALTWHQEDRSGTAADVTLVEGDINGDGKADFHIEFTGLIDFSSGDFIL
jgi:serralysin